MRIKKKGESGEVAQYMSRTQAVRKLQLTLPDFRRLCILKGIYPREPKNRKKVGKGNSALKTYYFTKDIAYLAHEPLIQKFRDMKVFLRKLKKAEHKKEDVTAARLKENEPKPKIDHIIRDRYPTFVDALRDLDDALCLVFLFAALPQDGKVKHEYAAKCSRLAAEFLHYCTATRSLRKAFLSIKGIYYQAEINGTPVTWIAPYQFSSTAPADVDFRIMETFLHLYTTLVGFVNFRLFKELNLAYPPALDAAGHIVAAATAEAAAPAAAAAPKAAKAPKGAAASQSLAALKAALPGIAASAAAGADAEDGKAPSAAAAAAAAATAAAEAAPALDEFPAQMEGGDGVLAEAGEIARAAADAERQRHLFDKCFVFLSREVPRYSVEFVVAACGGKVSWAGVGGEGGGPFAENDPRITHHVVDRPNFKPVDLKRHYVQPQWVYDSLNAKRLMETAPYAPGATLPAHLSPFVQEGAEDYVPPERTALMARAADEDAPERGHGNDSVPDDDDDEEAEEIADSDDDDAVYQAEMEQELAGVTEFPEKALKPAAAKKAAAAAAAAGGKKAGKKATPEEVAAEEKELATIMMPKKHRRLYQRIMYTKEKKQEEREKLERKRKAHDDAAAGKKVKA